MAKTIRSHPTSHILVLEPFVFDYSHILKIWPRNGPYFSPFPDLPISKKTGPQRSKDAHGPSLHIRFLSKCNFWYCIYRIFSMFLENPTFLNCCHILIILCISDSKMGDPILLWLCQNRTLISNLKPYPKGISVNGIFHVISRPSDEVWTKFGRSLEKEDEVGSNNCE